MSQPLLSIGMIVKNEERCLEKCLKALEPLRQAIPCELVIADTGSTDKTKEIAAKYADILFECLAEGGITRLMMISTEYEKITK